MFLLSTGDFPQALPATLVIGRLLRLAPGEDSVGGAGQVSQDRARQLLEHARDLRGEIEQVDDALREAEDSTRLNPRALRLVRTLPAPGARP